MIYPHTPPPSIAKLVDAAHLLECGLIWEPEQYPDGPGEAERPMLTAAIAVAGEYLRANLTTPATMPAMRVIHRRCFAEDAEQVLKHSVAALSYHVQILRTIGTEEKTVEDAVHLIITAMGLITTGLSGLPYQRVEFASTAPGTGPCTTCGVEHG